MRSYSSRSWLAGALFLSACAAPLPAEEELAPRTFQKAPLTADNGSDLNGSDLNGSDLNSSGLSNFVVSVNLGPVTHYLPGNNDVRVYDRVWLDGTSFWTIENGDTVYGQSFTGAEFTGNLGNGSTVKLRIRSITAAPAPNDDLRLYDVAYRDNSGVWVPACHDATGAPVLAMPVQGVWNYQQDVPGGGSKLEDSERFTFACMGGAIAKCVLWGYRPWATYNGTSLAQYHQACTRMVRADYCGTGRSYTKTGNRINFYDTLGIQQDTESWVFEAAWDVNGAQCFYALNRSHSSLPCFDARADLLCGMNPTSNNLGVLLRDETPGTLGVDLGL